jgi:hypothetical protein
MDVRDAPHLRSNHRAAAAPWQHRRSDPSPQRNPDRPNHHRIWSDSNAGKSTDYKTCSETAVSLRGVSYSPCNETQSTPAQERDDNELEVTLSFENRDGFNGIAFLDTGAKDNWISDSLSRHLLLPRKGFREEVFASFEGRRVRCSESVHGHWHYGHQTFPVTFKICKDLPVDVLFGFDLLRQVGLVNFEEDNEANLKKVFVLAKMKAKKGQSVPVHPSMKELAANKETHR